MNESRGRLLDAHQQDEHEKSNIYLCDDNKFETDKDEVSGMPDYHRVSDVQPDQVKKAVGLASDDANSYDVDNYASIDSQLGKYDINFKQGEKGRPKKRSSAEVSMPVLQYDNSLD